VAIVVVVEVRGSTAVKHSTHYPEVKGMNPAAGDGEREKAKMFIKD
jgi:hypothetical protein